jgi:hypothetical protein
VDPKAQPALSGPASKYSVLLADVGTNAYLTDVPRIFVLDAKSYGGTSGFSSPQEGETLLSKWGYVDGYEAALNPEGFITAVLNGAYFIYVETHIFKSSDGAHEAFKYFQDRIRANGIGQAVTTSAVGNESGAWKTVQGKVGSSNISQAAHQIVFRRGNLVAIVQTVGADPFMRVDQVRAIAAIVDGKALGQLEALAPTPSTYRTPAKSPAATPNASATPQR